MPPLPLLLSAGLLEEASTNPEWVRLQRVDLPYGDMLSLLGADTARLERVRSLSSSYPHTFFPALTPTYKQALGSPRTSTGPRAQSSDSSDNLILSLCLLSQRAPPVPLPAPVDPPRRKRSDASFDPPLLHDSHHDKRQRRSAPSLHSTLSAAPDRIPPTRSSTHAKQCDQQERLKHTS